MWNKGWIGVLLVLILLGGCASFKGPAKEDEIIGALERISNGTAEDLVVESHDPFLLDGEVLVGKAALSLLWTGMKDAGFRFTNPVVVELLPADEGQAEYFSSSQEVKYFFQNYAGPGATFCRFQSDQGAFMILLSPKEEGTRKILGWGGPVS